MLTSSHIFKKLLALVFGLALIAVVEAQSDSVSLLFIGDVMGHSTQINSALRDDGNRYDYSECFKYISPLIKTADVAVANLEVTLAGEPYTGYPTFSSPDELALALRDAGVDVLGTANNHSLDRRRQGLERTVRVLEAIGMPRTGTFPDSADRAQNNPLKMVVNGFRLAILNYTYGTNGIPVTPPNVVNHLNRELIKADILDARQFNPDQIIAFVHWGREYQTSPHADQIALTLFFHQNEVNIVVGSHPHVIQPMHLTANKEGQRQLVVYSLGNYISNQRKPLTDGGAMVRVVLKKEGEKAVIEKAEHILTWVHYPVINGRRHYYVLPAYGTENIAAEVPKGYEKMDDYIEKARQVMKRNTNVPEENSLPPTPSDRRGSYERAAVAEQKKN